jgi:hypothetical protein
MRFSDVTDIRTVSVNEAIETGLMAWWLDVMLTGFMNKVSKFWMKCDKGKVLLREATTSNDEALLYYVLSNVGAGENWKHSFVLAKREFAVEGKDKFKSKTVLNNAISTILSKENMKRGKSYTFAETNVKTYLAPLVQHVKKARDSDIGKTWDEHLQTIWICKQRALKENGQSGHVAASANKKAKDKLSDKNKLSAMMAN